LSFFVGTYQVIALFIKATHSSNAISRYLFQGGKRLTNVA